MLQPQMEEVASVSCRGSARSGARRSHPGRIVAVALLLIPAALHAQATLDIPWEDPDRFVGAEACGECHVAEYRVWKETTHATGFKTLHVKEPAELIAGKLGFRLIKRDSLCIRCHYTPVSSTQQLRARSGVSCESCHGAARDWLSVHNDYGGKGIDYQSESATHREQRIRHSVAAGMRRPSLLYDVATTCYGCHLVPEERLVNDGGHNTGSGGFELVAWSQGKIRHNFLAARRGGGEENRERSPAQRRTMYVVGRAVELESALRGAAAATGRGVYLTAMQRRVRVALGELREIGRVTALPEVDELLRLARGVEVEVGRSVQLAAVADGIGALARGWVDLDGDRLVAVDPLMDGESTAIADSTDLPATVIATADVSPAARPGDARESDANAARPADSAALPTASTDPPESPESPEALASLEPTDSAALTDASRGSESEEPPAATPSTIHLVRRATAAARAARHRTLGTECSRCHAPQNQWWFDDPHYATAEPFFDEAPDNVQIARLYGVRPAEMARGDSVCMQCHGTVVSGRERRTVQDGVGCEGCHGAAGDYLEPHQPGDKEHGTSRPGYRAGLDLGMVELRDLDVRAATCIGCHLITDARLISAGHRTGEGFDYLGGLSRARHWDQPLEPTARLASAFEQALAVRGAPPRPPSLVARVAVEPASSPEQAGQPQDSPSATVTATTFEDNEATTGVSVSVSRGSEPRAPAPRPTTGAPVSEVAAPAARTASGARAAIAVAPAPSPPRVYSDFPEVDEQTSIEEILRILKRRLERLHAGPDGSRP